MEIPLLAVAKGPTRKKLDLRTFGSVPELPEKTIEQIRDEAHRFAIGYHRKMRDRLKK
jgi:excinuclease UvrABC nuclease subunit